MSRLQELQQLGCRGSILLHPLVEKFLDIPRRFAQMSQTDHAAAALESMECAADRSQRRRILGSLTQRSEVLGDGREHFLGFLEEDAQEFRIARDIHGSVVGSRGLRQDGFHRRRHFIRCWLLLCCIFVSVAIPARRDLRALHDLFELGTAHAKAFGEHVEGGQHAHQLVLLRLGGGASRLQCTDHLATTSRDKCRAVLIQDQQRAVDLREGLSRVCQIVRLVTGEVRIERGLRRAEAREDLGCHLCPCRLRISFAQSVRLQADVCRLELGFTAHSCGQTRLDCRDALLQLLIDLGPNCQRIFQKQQRCGDLDGDRAIGGRRVYA